MKKSLVLLSLLSILFAVAMMVGGGCSSDSSDPSPLNVTGTWTIQAVGYQTMTAVLTHNGTAVTGTVSDTTSYAQTIAGTTTAASGATTPRNIQLIITFSDGMAVTLTGLVNDTNTGMDGTYQDTQNQSGSWTATRL